MIVVDVALANADPVSASMKVKACCSVSSSAVSLLIFSLWVSLFFSSSRISSTASARSLTAFDRWSCSSCDGGSRSDIPMVVGSWRRVDPQSSFLFWVMVEVGVSIICRVDGTKFEVFDCIEAFGLC